MGLRYPPVLDSKLEQAAAGLEALMSDLAGAGASGVAAEKQLPAAEGAAAGGEVEEEGRGVNPQAEQRIGSLADKVRQWYSCKCVGAGCRVRRRSGAGMPEASGMPGSLLMQRWLPSLTAMCACCCLPAAGVCCR